MFKNEATPEIKKSWDGKERPNYYGFTMASIHFSQKRIDI
jgi:hypothetical protein